MGAYVRARRKAGDASPFRWVRRGMIRVAQPLPPRVGRPPAPIQHGTEGGYHKELRRGLVTCPDCMAAHAAYVRSYRSRESA